MNRDLRNQLKPLIAIEPQVINTQATVTGEIIDCADFNDGIVFTMFCDHSTGTFTPLVEHGDESNLSDNAAVPDTMLIGDTTTAQEAGAALSASRLVSSIGVVNNLKRYVRLSVISSDTSGTILGTYGAIVQGVPRVTPDY